MAFYGFDPAQYVQKDKYGIGAASQILGKAIPAAAIATEEQKKIDEAVEAAKKNWTDMETAYSTIRNQYMKNPNVQALLNTGQMTQEEFRANMARLTKPTSIDKKDPKTYIVNISKNFGTLIEEAAQRNRQGQLTTAAQAARQPEFGFEAQPAPGQAGQMGLQQQRLTGQTAPAPETEEQFTQKFGQVAQERFDIPEQEITPEQRKTAQEFAGLPTQQQVQAQEAREKPKEMTPYQKWRVQHEEKVKAIDTKLKQDVAEVKAGKIVLKDALKRQKEHYKMLKYDTTKQIDVLNKELADLGASMPLTMKEQKKDQIQELKENVKEYNKNITSPELVSLTFLPQGEYEFKEGVPIRQKEGGVGGGVGSTQQAVQFDVDVLAEGAKLRARGIPEEDVQAFMVRRQREKQGQ